MQKPVVTAEQLLREIQDFKKAMATVSSATLLVDEIAELLENNNSKPTKAELILLGMKLRILIQPVTGRLFTLQTQEMLELSGLFKILSYLEVVAEKLQ